MAALEFKFSSDQQHQLEAIEATCDLFRGQQFIGSVFSADSGRKGQTAIGELMVGHGNKLRVAPGQLLDNLHAVQEEGCLPATDVLTDGRLRDFTVEMETGTGKTYVYIRSIYELNRRYGITKFVIVVPSVGHPRGRPQEPPDHPQALRDALRPHAARLLRVRLEGHGAGG